MKKQNGITLISLIITIIIMLILAGVALSMVMGDSSMLEQANSATEKTRAGMIKDEISLALAEQKAAEYSNIDARSKEDVIEQLYNDGNLTEEEVQKLQTQSSIIIEGEEIDFGILRGLNQYGFYFDRKYICKDYQAMYTLQDVELSFSETNGITINSIGRDVYQEGISLRMYDFGRTLFTVANPLEYNKKYYGTGTLDAECMLYVNDSGIAIQEYKISPDKIQYMNNKVDLGNGGIILEFSDNGKSFQFNGCEFLLK